MARHTPFAPEELDRHGFLDGRITVAQPVRGYRSGADTVLLAAACPARAGQRVLDLGCGAGVAALCLAARVPGVDLHGLELQEGYAVLAEANAHALGMPFTLHRGDVAAPPASLRAVQVDHVLTNPPYYEEAATSAPADTGKDRAFREAASLGTWIDCALRRLMPGGWLTMIHRTDRLPQMLGALEGRAGSIAILPLAARAHRPATRVILRARKGGAAPLMLHPPFVMHEGERHLRDGENYSASAEQVLRQGAALEF
jgi:tRNA1(Val) A37 N6-methylase TrmN6